MKFRLRLRAEPTRPEFLERYKEMAGMRGVELRAAFLLADAYVWVVAESPALGTEEPVLVLGAALFESKAFMLVEFAMTDPRAPAWLTYEASLFALERIRDRATAGSLYILAHTSSRGVMRVLKRRGFEQLPYATFGCMPFSQVTLPPKRKRFEKAEKPKRRRGPVRKKKARKT